MIMEFFHQKRMQKDSLLIDRLKKTRVFLLSLMFLSSCAEKVIEPPENLITKDKMTNILYDLALLNSANSTNPNALKNNSVEIMPYIFEKYNIDSIQFSQSDIYYASIPLEYEVMYKTIQSRLENEVKLIDEARQEKTTKAREKADQVRDSLKKASMNSKPPVLSKKESNSSE